MRNYPERYKAMLKGLGINNKKVAEITGRTYGTVRSAVMPNTKNFPKWAKLAIWVYESSLEGEKR